MKIRQAKHADWRAIQNLNHDLFIYEQDNFLPVWETNWPLTKEGENYFQRIIISKDHCVLVAEKENKIIGYLVGILKKNITHKKGIPTIARLEHMIIKEELRRQGIGKELFRKFDSWSKDKKADRMEVDVLFNNERTTKFYKELGFEDFEVILSRDIK